MTFRRRAFAALVSVAAILVVSGLFAPQFRDALAQGFSLPHNSAITGHLITSQAAPPVGTGCTIVAGSTDLDGSCTTSATSGSIAFATAFVSAPFCIVQDSTATPVFVYTTTTAQITLTTVTSAHVLFWHCAAKVGG